MRSLILLPAFAAAMVFAQGGFSDECEQWQLGWGGVYPWMLAAECPDAADKLHASFINLGDCITNSEGKLEAKKNGGAFGTCSGCSLDNSTITCTCRRTFGGSVPASFDLNAVIANTNGIVGCFDYPGIEIPSIEDGPA